MKKLLMVMMLSAASAAAEGKPPILESVAYYGGLAAVDIYTTNRGEHLGMVEKNPFMQNSDSRYVIWGAKTAVMVALDQTVDKGSRRFIRIANGVLTGVIVGNYFYQEHRQRQHPVAAGKRGFAVSYTVRWK